MKLKGKVALITGDGSCFGRATAILFANEGAKVVVVDKYLNSAQETVRMIKEGSGEAICMQADVSILTDCENMVKVAMGEYSRLDILHNNAGISMASSTIEDMDEASWDRVIGVNLKSVFLGSKVASPVMKRLGAGVILNTSSVSGVRVRPGSGPYAVSKAAINHLTRILALELAPFRIRVNSMSPVIAETPLFRALWTEEMKRDEEATRKALLSTIPLGRFAELDDVAKAALYLASDDSSMITGIDLLVDGGRAL